MMKNLTNQLEHVRMELSTNQDENGFLPFPVFFSPSLVSFSFLRSLILLIVVTWLVLTHRNLQEKTQNDRYVKKREELMISMSNEFDIYVLIIRGRKMRETLEHCSRSCNFNLDFYMTRTWRLTAKLLF